jgi:glutamate/tyrosine decarboxylase-like PLP-dependent enzyme
VGVKDLLKDAAERAIQYLEGLENRRVTPTPEALIRLRELDHPLPSAPQDPASVISLLDGIGSPATVASAGGRFFGFVVGGSLPAALAANWLAGAWDQDAGLWTLSPTAATLEEVSLRWLTDLFGFPKTMAGGFVTGATMANFTALAAARHAILAREGWDVDAQGLFGAPPIDLVVGEEVHVSVLKALGLLGLGRERVSRVQTDGKGRMRPERLPKMTPRTILCLQAGNVNTGAFDPGSALCPAAHAGGAWVHVDGAFGLWARTSPRYAHLLAGYEEADSFATDCHKWLNVPYDSGIAFVTSAEALRSAMAASGAAYLMKGGGRDPADFTPELSRRSRGVEVWAALLSLGRSGLADLVDRTCRHATRFAKGLEALGWSLLNDVVLNQVLVARENDDATRRAVSAIQTEGTFFCSGTTWKGRAAMRVSVSSWATSEEDVERSLLAIGRLS